MCEKIATISNQKSWTRISAVTSSGSSTLLSVKNPANVTPTVKTEYFLSTKVWLRLTKKLCIRQSYFIEKRGGRKHEGLLL